MKAYDKYLNEEKDRLVEVHTDWLKEVDSYIKRLEAKIKESDLNLLETREIFIGRFERLDKRIKEFEEDFQKAKADREAKFSNKP